MDPNKKNDSENIELNDDQLDISGGARTRKPFGLKDDDCPPTDCECGSLPCEEDDSAPHKGGGIKSMQ